MAEKYPSFPLWYQDLEADEVVQLMNTEQFGCYIWLLIRCWHEGSLPKDMPHLKKLAKYKGRDFKNKIWKLVGAKFCLSNDSRLHNKRVDELRLEIKNKKQKLSLYGKEGAERRWGGHSQAIPTERGGHSNLSSSLKSSLSLDKDRSGGTDLLNFSEEQIHTLKAEISKVMDCSIMSEANTESLHFVLAKIKKSMRKQTVTDPFAYALTTVRNLRNKFQPTK